MSELTFSELLKLFSRRKWIIGLFVLVAAGIGLLVSMFTKPEYEASFRILLEGATQARTGSSAGLVSDFTLGNIKYDILTQMEILKSQKVYGLALDKANIPRPRTQQEQDNAPQIRIDQIDVSQVVLVTVKARSKDEVQAMSIALPQVYDDMIMTEQRDEIKRLRDTLVADIKASKDDLLLAQSNLAEYQAQNDIIDAQLSTQTKVGEEQRTQQLAEQAQAEALAAKANYDNLVAQRVPEVITERTEETNTEETRANRQLLSQLKSEREQLLTHYHDDHPKVIAINARIKSVENEIANVVPKTVPRTITHPNPEYTILQTKVRDAKAAWEAAEARANSFELVAQNNVFDPGDLGRIRLEIAKLQTQIDDITTRKKQQQLQLDTLDMRNHEIKSPVVRLDSTSTLIDQTKPRWTLNIVLAALIGLMLGAFVAIARDLSLDRVNYPAEAVGVAGADILARIPLRARSRSALIEDPQRARAFEAYRVLRSGVLFAMENSGNNAVVVTSAEHGDGKTVVAGNLAVACALEGRRTVIVDANLRSPKLDRLFRVQAGQGLTDVIAGEIGLDAVLQDGSVPNLQILPAGNKLATPTEYIASSEMKRIIETLKQRFDVVIFDSPDSLSVADSVELARLAENVLFIVEMEKTSKSRMDQSLMYLRQAKARVIGLVVNRDPSVHERYS